jgi:copper(I)-binding protein
MLAAMKLFTSSCVAALSLAAGAAFAQVQVEGAWARPTVPGQPAGGGYLAMTAATGDRLVSGSSSAAARVELHPMAMKGDVMEMREVTSIDLPAGKKVELKPGGLHLMFIGLKAPLKVGAKIPVTLKFEKAGEVKVDFTVMVKPAAPEHKH